MTLDNVQALPLGTQLGDFRLDAVIGHGGFGITYRAFDTQLAKIVAIKEYLPVECAVRGSDGQAVPRGARFADDFAWGRERFLDEARALARFRHRHIVPVLRYFEANGTAYTVMEFEDGRSVAQLLREPGRRLQPDDIRRLVEGLLSGLGAVHAKGFLHRDIKPSNIIIRRDGVPILIDFGAARQAMGGRTRTLTSILTPQYAPIEQYALDGKQGPWTDIYSAAAVLHHAIVGQPPPEAVARVGTDPYRPLAETQAGRFEPSFLAAIDRGLAFAPDQRPQTVEEWNALFGIPLSLADDAPTQRLAGPQASPRLGGVSREIDELVAPPPLPGRRSWAALWVVFAVMVLAAAALWRFQPEIRDAAARAWPAETPAAPAMPPFEATQATAPPTAATPPPQAATPDAVAQRAMIGQAERAASEARAVLELAEEAAKAAQAMAGEARIAATRAASAGLENAERLSYADGTSYLGQTAAGKRQGLGVAELKDGERQAGEWQNDRLHGLGTVRLADDSRYAGQWRDGQSTGFGLREKPGAERAEGNFVDGRLEGVGIRHALGPPNLVQSGEWHGDSLDGPGIESVGERERYQGGFRAGRRHGYGQLIGADGTVRSGRWEEGKLVESAP